MVKFLSQELNLSQLQGEESYPPGPQGIGESLFLGAVFQGQNHRLGGEDATQRSRITTNALRKARRLKLNADTWGCPLSSQLGSLEIRGQPE